MGLFSGLKPQSVEIHFGKNGTIDHSENVDHGRWLSNLEQHNGNGYLAVTWFVLLTHFP